MIEIDELVERLQKHRKNRGLLKLSSRIGMPYQQLRRIALGHVKNPGVATVKPLVDYFEYKDNE